MIAIDAALHRPAATTPVEISRLLRRVYRPAFSLMWLLTWLRPFICPFERLLDVIPDRRSFLDIGCGVGLMSTLVAHTKGATRIVGIDTSSQAIATARTARMPAATHAEFHCVSVEDPWPQEQFDAVLCLDVLHHVPAGEQRAFIHRLATLNFTDRICFKDVSCSPRWKAWGSHIHDLLIAGERIHIRHENEVKRWFEEEGLAVTTCRRIDTLWYTHYMLVAERRRGEV